MSMDVSPWAVRGRRQIWLSDTLFCIVDDVDYEWAIRWKWHPTANSTGKKFYATRMTRERGTRKNIKIYLHKEILKCAGKRPPAVDHTIGDHDDGESLHNWRGNLFWATLRMNNTKHRYQHVLQWAERRYGADFDAEQEYYDRERAFA